MTRHAHINVLVTGMGPYPSGGGIRIDPNISHVLTTMLPHDLKPNSAINPTSNHINIVTLPTPIKTEYAYIRRFCQALHRGKHEHKHNRGIEQNSIDHKAYDDVDILLRDIDVEGIDLVIHLGEARGWWHMTIERMAFKQGFTSTWWQPSQEKAYYDIPDDRGQTVYDLGACPWDDVPLGLQTALDVDAVADGANAVLGTRSRFTSTTTTAATTATAPSSTQTASEADCIKTDLPAALFGHATAGQDLRLVVGRPIEVKPHREGGPYCCGFTNYESLASCYVNKRVPDVLFCHVPGLEDEQGLIWQRDGVIATVVSAADQVVRQRM